MQIAVGGGLTGLALARTLCADHRVTLFENADRLGGLNADDPLLGRPDDEPEADFLQGLARMFHGFDRNVPDFHSATPQGARAQPLQVLNYARRVPTITTRPPDLVVLNTAQLVDNALNNNEVIRQVRAFTQDFQRQLTTTTERAGPGRRVAAADSRRQDDDRPSRCLTPPGLTQ